MKFTDEQKELLAILPKTLKNSKELTDSSKLVLSNIIFLYGIEEAQKNGFVYRTNTKMMEETGIKSEHTLIVAIRHLELLGIIETKRGKRKEASTYKLLKNCSETPKNCSNKCSEIETLQNQVLLLQKDIVLLQKEIENLKNCSKKCSTDTDIDEDIEIDKAPVDNVTEVTLHENNKIKNINIKTSDEVTLQENNKIYNINIKTSEDITPDDGTLQDDEVNNNFLNNSDDDWLNYEVKRSMMGEVNNDLKLNDMKKENEMSDNGTNAMNAISEQSERQASENESSESGTINEMATSTLGDKNNTSKEYQNIPVDKSKVINNNCNVQGVNPNAKDCAPAPATEEWKPVAWDEDAIFGSGEPQNVSGDKLPTNEEKTCQEAQKCPQNEFNRERMLELFKISAKETVLERFKEQLKEMDAYMQYLKKNDHFTYKIYLKEILSWWNNPMNVWNSDFDVICVGNGFKRKYVA